MSPRDPGSWPLALWLTVCFGVSGALGGLLCRRMAPGAGVDLMLFWLLAWGALGAAGGLALRATRRS